MSWIPLPSKYSFQGRVINIFTIDICSSLFLTEVPQRYLSPLPLLTRNYIYLPCVFLFFSDTIYLLFCISILFAKLLTAQAYSPVSSSVHTSPANSILLCSGIYCGHNDLFYRKFGYDGQVVVIMNCWTEKRCPWI